MLEGVPSYLWEGVVLAETSARFHNKTAKRFFPVSRQLGERHFKGYMREYSLATEHLKFCPIPFLRRSGSSNLSA
jgi:hypothetical protein